MAIINCPECNAEVSSTATKCPKCGFRINKPKRSFMGKVFKYLFIVFNVLMLAWVFSALGNIGHLQQAASSSAESAGVAIGTGIGMYFLFTIWALGDIIFGALAYFTRARD